MIWKRYNWLADLVIPLLVAVLRVCWLAPWLEVVHRALAQTAPAPVLPTTLLLAVPLVSLFLARFLLANVKSMGAARLIQMVAGFAAILFALWWQFYRTESGLLNAQWLQAMQHDFTQWQAELPDVMIALPVIVYLWLRGTLDAPARGDRGHVWGAFASGFVALLLCIIVALASKQGLPPRLSSDVFAFFAVAMAALALSSIESARDAAGGGGSQVRLDRYWLASVASVIVALLAIGLFFSLLITPDVAARAFAWTSGIFELVGRLLYLVVLVVAYFVFLLLGPLITLIQSAMRANQQTQQTPASDLQNQLAQFQKGTLELPHAVTVWLPWIGLAVVILVVGLAFALALRQLQRRGERDVDETRELILSRDLLAQQIAEWRSGLRRGRRQAAPAGSPFLSLEGEEEGRRRIRAVYQMFLQAMGARGHPRQPGQTPVEYQQDAQTTVPGADEALGAMTVAYQEARYARQAPSSSTVTSATRAWDDVEKVLKPKESND